MILWVLFFGAVVAHKKSARSGLLISQGNAFDSSAPHETLPNESEFHHRPPIEIAISAAIFVFALH